ncbi:hypothetical protein [Rhodopirellula baltica]|uniref:hypothetical protein n=1 Tax=Rhodopirellula baltica TaxID=265606 RepID=UPI001F333E23|nr:hypothetical protein [Rhodopirellula baltica]
MKRSRGVSALGWAGAPESEMGVDEAADESGSGTESVWAGVFEVAFSSVGLAGSVIVESFLLIQFEGWFTSGFNPKIMPMLASRRRTKQLF